MGSSEPFTLPIHYLRVLADQLRRMQVEVSPWLARHGLSEAQLLTPALTLSFSQFAQLAADALNITGEPALGLFVGERLIANTHGILGYAAFSSTTLRQALDLLQRYARLRTTIINIDSESDARVTCLHIHEVAPLGDIRRPLLEALLLSIKNVMDAMSSSALPIRVAFPFKQPPYIELARALFRCPLEYDAKLARISLSSDVLDVPLQMADPDAFREAQLICQRELEKLTAASASTAQRVRRLLLEHQRDFPSLQLTARLLNMTTRTLHRRLAAENTSYRRLLEEVRHAIAVERVKSEQSSIEEIAYALGYSDLSNFRRAFKRWEQVPPSTYRSTKTPSDGDA